MPECIVHTCTSRRKSDKKLETFMVPRNLEILKKWEVALRKTKRPLEPGQIVCEKHFLPSDILRERYLVGADGQVLGVTRYKVARLRRGAVPCFFPWTTPIPPSENENPPPTQEHESLSESFELNEEIIPIEAPPTPPIPITMEDPPENDDDTVQEDTHNDSTELTYETIDPTMEIPHSSEQDSDTVGDADNDSTQLTFDEIDSTMDIHNSSETADDAGEDAPDDFTKLTFETIASTVIKLPPNWTKRLPTVNSKRILNFSIAECTEINGTFSSFFLKEVFITEEMKLQINVLGCALDLRRCGVDDSDVHDAQKLEDLLHDLHALPICPGLKSCHVLYQENNDFTRCDNSNSFRHYLCPLLIDHDTKICALCKRINCAIATRIRRQKLKENIQ